MMKVMLFWICAAVAVTVFGVMIHSIATFRLLPDADSTASERSTVVEVVWALIPILIVIAVALPALKALAN